MDSVSERLPDSCSNQSVLDALNIITRGRIVMNWEDVTSGRNHHVVTKTSHIPGKSVIEIPGLVYGSPDTPVKRLGVAMTLTESVIELASAMELDLLVVHHPVAEAANSGGVPFGHYLPLYNLSVIELHEAFHGLHPGITRIHGHEVLVTDTSFGGIPGNVLHVGIALRDVRTAGDILRRIDSYLDTAVEEKVLASERVHRQASSIEETTLANPSMLLNGSPDSPVRNVLHFFPHTGFNPEHLKLALEMYPDTDTVIASISRVRATHPLVAAAKQHNLTFLVGTPHSVEIFENGLPLAYALDYLLPGVEVHVLRDRVTATPLEQAGHSTIREYGREMAMKHLVGQADGKATTARVKTLR